MLGHARTRLVDGVVRQAASAECDFSRHPCRIIRTLGVIRVPVDVSLFALIVFPLHIPVCRSGTVVSDFVVADGGRRVIFASCQFVPLIIRQSVAIRVFGYKHDSRFGVSSGFIQQSAIHIIVGVAVYLEVIFTGDVGDGMVESHGNVTSESSEREETGGAVLQQFGGACQHLNTGESLFVSSIRGIHIL